MGRLSDILHGNGNGDIRDLWDKTEAAAELAPLPAGTYAATIVKGELFTSKEKQTPGYRLEFVVDDGDFRNRRFWADCWLTPAALPQTKRDLQKLGCTDLAQLERPLPARFRCQVKLVLRKDDNGEMFNKVRRFDVTGIEKIPRDPFAPDDEPDAGTPGDGNAATGEPDAAGTGEPDAAAVTTAAATPDGTDGKSEGTAAEPIPF